jgi:propanol-preferring alcohol dehydrogenase
LIELLNLGGRGLIESRITRFPLDQASDAYQALKAGEVEGRAVVIPSSTF